MGEVVRLGDIVPKQEEIGEFMDCHSDSGIEMPLKDGTTWTVPPDLLVELSNEYKEFHVPECLREARLWLIANPKKRKTRRGSAGFCTNWMRNQRRFKQQDDERYAEKVEAKKLEAKEAKHDQERRRSANRMHDRVDGSEEPMSDADRFEALRSLQQARETLRRGGLD